MRTLDETIKGLAICCSTKDCVHEELGKCPYNTMSDRFIMELHEDALHYLKEYRKLDSLDAVVFSEEADDNPALTWEQLKQMEGKPVWVEWISGCWKGSSKWVLINGIDDLMIMFTAIDVAMESYGGHLREISLGKTWQAYRKEKDGADSRYTGDQKEIQ